MTDLTPNHPAVEAAARELAQLDAGDPWPSNDDLGGHHILGTRDDEYRFAMLEEARAVLNTVLPHLTADDLRHTPAGRQLMAEGWDARPPEPLPCGCENPFNAIHLLDHRPTERRDQ